MRHGLTRSAFCCALLAALALPALAAGNGEEIYKQHCAVCHEGNVPKAPGPVIAGGMVYVNSGYSYLGWTPGNVLLAFSVDGK